MKSLTKLDNIKPVNLFLQRSFEKVSIKRYESICFNEVDQHLDYKGFDSVDFTVENRCFLFSKNLKFHVDAEKNVDEFISFLWVLKCNEHKIQIRNNKPVALEVGDLFLLDPCKQHRLEGETLAVFYSWDFYPEHKAYRDLKELERLVRKNITDFNEVFNKNR